MTSKMRRSMPFLCLLPLFTYSSAFTIRDPTTIREPHGVCKKHSSFFVASPVYQRDFELLIQAATSSSNGYALGGDFAGLAATFDPGDGSFIPIPEHLVPEALLDWGQEPKCLEVLVSEDFNGDALERSTITVLPDTGCSIDNLETIKVLDEIDLSTEWGKDTKVVGLQYQSEREDEIRLETIFGLRNGHRMRVALDLIPSETVFAIQSPMVIALERRTSSVSSGGTIADGGGLDGRTVSMLLGEDLRKSKTFAEEMPLEENFESNGINHVSLPGGVSLAYGWLTDDDWVVQVGHIQDGVRRVVSRHFTTLDGEEVDFNVESWEEEVDLIDVDAE